MLFMVIERFRDNDMVPVYRRLRDSGRTLPKGLEYVDSWIEPNFSRCFQLMRCDDPRLFQQWALESARLGHDARNRPRRHKQRDASDRRALSRSARAGGVRRSGASQQRRAMRR